MSENSADYIGWSVQQYAYLKEIANILLLTEKYHKMCSLLLNRSASLVVFRHKVCRTPVSLGRKPVQTTVRAAIPEASDAEQRATGFSVLNSVHIILGGATVLFPNAVINGMYAASPTPLVSGLVVTLGSLYMFAALVSYTLVSAAKHERLESDTYKRLSGGLAVWGSVSLGMSLVSLVSPGSVYQQPLWQYGQIFLHSLTLAIVMMNAKGMILDWKTWNPLNRILSLENVYGFAALSVPAAVIAVLVHQFLGESFLGNQLHHLNWITVPAGSLGILLVTQIAAASVLLYAAFVTLLDASQRGRLGASTFKLLNLGISMVSAIWAYRLLILLKSGMLFLPTIFSPYLSHIMDIFSMKISIFFPLVGFVCLFQYFTAKK